MPKLFDVLAIQKSSHVILIALMFCCLFAAGLGGLKLNASYNAYFDPQDPTLITHRAIQDSYSINDGILVVLEFDAPIIFAAASLELLNNIVRALSDLESVRHVRSIFDLPANQDSEFDEMDAEILGVITETPADNLRTTKLPQLDMQTLRTDPRAAGLLFSEDETAVVLELSLVLPDNIPAPKLLATLGEIRLRVEQEIQSQSLSTENIPEVRLSGPLALNEAYISVIRHDLTIFLPTLVISILLTLSVLFRSLKIAAISLLIAGLAVVSSFGMAGWMGFELAAIDAFAPVIIASIALAGTVHILNTYATQLALGVDKRQAIIDAFRDNAFPLMLTMLTTAGGFLALTFSPSPPIRTIGYIVALGILTAWIYILVLLPALLQQTAAHPVRSPWIMDSLVWIYQHSKKYPSIVLGAVATLGVGAALLVGENQINDNVFEYFPKSHQFRVDADVLQHKFSGVNPAIFSVTSDAQYAALDIDFLKAVRAFQTWLRAQPEVRKTLSMIDFAKVRDNLADGSTSDIVRYRELAKLHSPAALGIQQLVDKRYRSLAVHTYLAPLDAVEQIQFDAKAKSWFAASYPNLRLESAGTSLVFAHLGQRNASSMIYALVLALVAISLVCMLLLKSVHAIWIGLLCNLFPLLVVYAGWALLDGKISIGGAVVIGMILGIVVDDTLYLLAKYRRTQLTSPASPHHTAVLSVGPALIITSLTLIVGLAAGLLSDFAPIRAMSGLSMSIIALALVTDICVLSVVLDWLSKRQSHVNRDT